MTRLTTLLMTGFLLAACGHSPDPETPAMTADAAQVITAENSGQAYPPRLAALPFRLDITVSSDVIRALDAAGAKLEVNAHYHGKARRTSDARIDLGEEVREVRAGNLSITLAGRFDAAQVAREVIGDPRVMVTAAVKQEGGPVVYCTAFDEALPIAVETGGFIHCELLSE